MNSTHQYEIQVQGRVQGVFFRASTRDKAVELGLNGTVRNLPNGSVEVIAQGEKSRLDELVSWCRRGPRMARVDSVTVQETEGVDLTDFRIVR